MIEAVKKVTDSIILIFSPITLPNLVNIITHESKEVWLIKKL